MKKYLILLSIISSLLSCRAIKTDGVYQAKKNDNSYYYYLRFYEDSTVLTVSSSGEPSDLKKWFNKEKDNISKGVYFVKKDSVIFESKSSNGIVKYKGVFKRNKMELYSVSEINRFSSYETYNFKRFKK